MKKRYLAIFMVLFSTFTFASEIKGVEIASINSRSGNERIIYSLEKGVVHFYLQNSEGLKELNTLAASKNKEMNTDSNYMFDTTEDLISATGSTYAWCWDEDESEVDWMNRNAGLGIYVAGIGAFASLALCATLPVVPAIAGIALAPVDGLITLGSYLFGKEEIASRKFNRLIQGKSSKADQKVMTKLKQKIITL